MEHQREAFVIDPAGGDISGESKRIRERGPAALVELPGQVVAWMVTDHALLKQLLTDSNVSKNPNLHWPAWRSGQIPADWPLALWVGVPNMFTAYGTEHRRLRTLVSSAFTARRTADLCPRIRRSRPSCSTTSPPLRPPNRSICARSSPTRCPSG